MHILAAREAVERFAHELPLGTHGDRLRRLAEATRQLLDQSVADRSPKTAVVAWADHNLGVLVAEALGQDAERGPFTDVGSVLYLGVRRRLLEALVADPDDLACALALALGVAATLADRDDLRLSEDIGAVTKALSRPGAGPRLAAAATRAVTQAGGRQRRPDRADRPERGERRGRAGDHKNQAGDGAAHAAEEAELAERTEAMQRAAVALASAVREGVERLGKRLPDHPELALDRIRLVLLSARATEGVQRNEALSMARALLSDFDAKFGPSDAQREVTATLVQLRAKDAPGAELARDALSLLELDAKERRVDPRRAAKLVRSLQRANALDVETARTIQRLVGNGEDGAWIELKAMLFEAVGDEAALLTLQERALEKDPKDANAAKTLFERLLKNLRRSLPSPFPATTLDLVTQAVPLASLGRLSADDVEAVLHALRDAFGVEKALGFARYKLTVARELKARDFVWKKALQLADEAKDEDALFDIARRAIQEKSAPPEARLSLARALIAKGQNLDEADDALKGLTSERGPIAAEAQQLKNRIKADPRYRDARVATLLAFEDSLGIGTVKLHTLKVVFTSPQYVLTEITDRPAPDFYEHKHLRVMLRGEDLPAGVKPTDLQKGDELKGPVRGQDAAPERDKDNLRIYWIADARLVKLALPTEALAGRLEGEDAAFGIGKGQPVPLKISWDAKKQQLVARLLDGGGREFRVRPMFEPEQLPEGIEAAHVGGRGKRFLGVVERSGPSQYKVVGKVVAAPEPVRTRGEGGRNGKADAGATEASETNVASEGDAVATPSDSGAAAAPSDSGAVATPSDSGAAAAPSDSGAAATPSDSGAAAAPSEGA